jgi:DeoR family fructose operon transcriptional repressor
MLLEFSVYADCALISADGITPGHGFSVRRLEEALVSIAMIASARRTIALAKSSAFGRNAFAKIGPLKCVQALVTDQLPPLELQGALASARVDVLVASAE